MASCIDVGNTMADYLLSCEIEYGMTKKTLEGKKETLSRLSKFLANFYIKPTSIIFWITSLTHSRPLPPTFFGVSVLSISIFSFTFSLQQKKESSYYYSQRSSPQKFLEGSHCNFRVTLLLKKVHVCSLVDN